MNLLEFSKLTKTSINQVYVELDRIRHLVPFYIQVKEDAKIGNACLAKLTPLGAQVLKIATQEHANEPLPKFVDVDAKKWESWPDLSTLRIGESVWRPVNLNTKQPLSGIRSYISRYKKKYPKLVFISSLVDSSDPDGQGARIKRIA